MLPNPDLLLARRAAAGQPEAWNELIALYGRRIFNLAFQFTGDVAEAEDLTQDIFLRLHQNLRAYRGDVPLVGWTLRLSRNHCIDHYRHARSQNRLSRVPEEILDHLPSASDPQAEATRREQLALVYRALAELPEELAEIVVLRDLQDLSYNDVAQALDLPLGTVKSRLNRARQELSDAVQRLLGSPGEQLPASVLSSNGEGA